MNGVPADRPGRRPAARFRSSPSGPPPAPSPAPTGSGLGAETVGADPARTPRGSSARRRPEPSGTNRSTRSAPRPRTGPDAPADNRRRNKPRHRPRGPDSSGGSFPRRTPRPSRPPCPRPRSDRRRTRTPRGIRLRARAPPGDSSASRRRNDRSFRPRRTDLSTGSFPRRRPRGRWPPPASPAATRDRAAPPAEVGCEFRYLMLNPRVPLEERTVAPARWPRSFARRTPGRGRLPGRRHR